MPIELSMRDLLEAALENGFTITDAHLWIAASDVSYNWLDSNGEGQVGRLPPGHYFRIRSDHQGVRRIFECSSEEWARQAENGEAASPEGDVTSELLLMAKKKVSGAETGSGEKMDAIIALRKVVGLDSPEIVAMVDAGLATASDKLKQELLKELRDPVKVEIVINGVETAEVKHPHEKLKDILPYAIARKNIFLAGPAGCGKTYLAEQVANSLNLRFNYMNLTGATSESVLVGRIDYFNGNKYMPSSFVDFYENGGVFLLDEMDGADPNMLMIVNTALAGSTLAVPDVEKPLRKKHKDFICVAAANTWGHGADRVYVGRNQLDGATLDRFRVAQFNMDYDERLEKLLGEKVVVEWAQNLRKKVRSTQLRRIVSTRWVMEASELKRAGLSWDSLRERFLEDWTPADKSKAGV